MPQIRLVEPSDWPILWRMLEPVFRAGETYAVARDISEAAAKSMWLDTPVETYLATDGDILGTFYIKTNHQGGGAHVCNCGYVTAPMAQGRGVASAMCTFSQIRARDLGYRAMQFNMVLASNGGAIALWQKLGFDTVGTLPAAFDHPRLGMVDGHVMWKTL
ncbi:MAG: GNAT family N-acetyltransferase [Octadecabacter sp.]